MARTIRPMLATNASVLPADDGWAYEVKWDGYRIVAFVERGTVRLHTRNLLDATAAFGELAGLAGAVGALDVVLDGEVVVFDEHGRPSFGALQQRGKTDASAKYMIFDVLEIGGTSTFSLGYRERRRLLDQLDLGSGTSWAVSPVHDDGAELLAATRRMGLEGIIAKRSDSVYEAGRRSRSWLKIKHWAGQEFVVGGWLPGEGNRSGGIGSLLLGYYDDAGSLRYAGRVGTGFSDAELARLLAKLVPLERETSPFGGPGPLPPEVRRHARYAAPSMVVEVAFAEWTDSATVRQPSYKGERFDKDPRAVVREST